MWTVGGVLENFSYYQILVLTVESNDLINIH